MLILNTKNFGFFLLFYILIRKLKNVRLRYNLYFLTERQFEFDAHYYLPI